ncbi:MAG: hypothetical protein ACU0GG_08265 [Paracoccaceae bacterium]
MGRDKKNERREAPFTFWHVQERDLPAWKALGWPAKTIYFHLRRRCFAETAQKRKHVMNNNGEVFASPRTLADETGGNVKTMMAALADLQAKGWIVCTQMWERGYDGQGRTALFRLTMLPTGSKAPFTPPTRDPERWTKGSDFPVLVYDAHTPGRSKKQNPPPADGALVNQQMVHCAENEQSSAPADGACEAQNRPSSVPDTGAYLLAIYPPGSESPEAAQPSKERSCFRAIGDTLSELAKVRGAG